MHFRNIHMQRQTLLVSVKLRWMCNKNFVRMLSNNTTSNIIALFEHRIFKVRRENIKRTGRNFCLPESLCFLTIAVTHFFCAILLERTSKQLHLNKKKKWQLLGAWVGKKGSNIIKCAVCYIETFHAPFLYSRVLSHQYLLHIP